LNPMIRQLFAAELGLPSMSTAMPDLLCSAVIECPPQSNVTPVLLMNCTHTSPEADISPERRTYVPIPAAPIMSVHSRQPAHKTSPMISVVDVVVDVLVVVVVVVEVDDVTNVVVVAGAVVDVDGMVEVVVVSRVVVVVVVVVTGISGPVYNTGSGETYFLILTLSIRDSSFLQSPYTACRL